MRQASPLQVSIIIINYNGKKFFPELFKSLEEQTFTGFEVIIVDNRSSDGSVEWLDKFLLRRGKLRDRISVLKLGRNVGFAHGNNIAARHATGKYILFLNSDAFMQRNSLEEMLRVIKRDTFIAGVTPKIYLSRYLPLRIFDAVGICMDNNGSPYNRGIGQLDFGQYDKEEEVMGLCFACCLTRRDIFLESGGLDSSYFAYFEDVDWSFRVRKQGYTFFTAPKAVVNHFHSGTSSSKSYAWKYNLIFRNYLRTVIKNFGKRNTLRIIKAKLIDLLRTALSRRTDPLLRRAMWKVLFGFMCKDLYIFTLKRLLTTPNFIPSITDESIFSLSTNEPSMFFDPQSYEARVDVKMLDFVVKRKSSLKDDSQMLESWNELRSSFYCSQYTEKWKEKFQVFVREHLDPTASREELSIIIDKLYGVEKARITSSRE